MSITCSCGSEQCRKTVSAEPLKDGRAALILRRGDEDLTCAGAIVMAMLCLMLAFVYIITGAF